MTRQVDVKAILTHIIRGDGLNKCRICMGDTKEGQVHLEDTVMMDGDKAVTLSEILEIITGIEMESDKDLPVGLCDLCTNSAVSAMQFRQACQKSEHYWTRVIDRLSLAPDISDHDKSLYIYLNEDKNILIDHYETDKTMSPIDRLNLIGDFNRRTKRKKGIKCPGLKCLDCGKEFLMPFDLNQHLKNSTKRACTECAKILPREKLGIHLKNRHGHVVHTCDKCYMVFDDIPQLDQHKTLYHSIIDCQCKICGHGFKNERSLRAHMYAHTLFHCRSCNRHFENRKCFLHHQLKCKEVNSTSASVYECHDCGNTYPKKPSLKTHIVSKHLNIPPHVCPVCGKRSTTLAHYKAHAEIHKIERKIYQCYCGANMKTLVGFQMHQRTHSGEKPYECIDCGERFISASRRLDHKKRRHWTSREMAHKCNICTASFLRPSELKKHYRNNHPAQINNNIMQ